MSYRKALSADKVRRHPDYEEIKKWLLRGISPARISMMLRERYPTRPDRWLGKDVLYRERDFLRKYEADVEAPEVEDIASRIMDLKGETPKPPKKKSVFSDEQLMSWCKGLEGLERFAREVCRWGGKPIILQDYQKEIVKILLEEPNSCFAMGGQCGKDFIIMLFSTWYAITNPNSIQLIVSAAQFQSDFIMERILNLLSGSKDLEETVQNSNFNPPAYIRFKNNARIYFLTAKGKIGGLTDVDRVYINEARDIKEEEVALVTPLLGTKGGKIAVFSRPRFRKGYFWRVYSSPVFKTLRIPTWYNQYIDKNFLEREKSTLDPILWRTEYAAEFAEVGSSFISEASIDKCSKEDYDFRALVKDPNKKYSLGIDWARYRDTAVFIVSSLDKEGRRRVEHIQDWDGEPTPFETQLAYARYLDSVLDLDWIVPEQAGLGIPLCERLLNEWRLLGKRNRVVPYRVSTVKEKLELYDELKRIIESNKMDIPRSALKLTNDLKLVQFGVTEGGVLRVEGAGDYSDALALSIWPFKTSFKIGVARVLL